MYAFMIVAFGAALFAIISVLNLATWERLAETRRDVQASRLIVEHTCAHHPERCPSDRAADNSVIVESTNEFNCIYTNAPDNGRLPVFAAVAEITKSSYLCVGKKNGIGVFEKHPDAAAEMCPQNGYNQFRRDIRNGAIVICERK